MSPKSPIPKIKKTNETLPENLDKINAISMDTDTNDGKFQTPKKFSTNFVKVLRQKAVRSLNLKLRYKVLTESESEAEEEPKGPPETQGGNSKTEALPKPINTATNTAKAAEKPAIPPIVVEGITDNHAKKGPEKYNL